MFPTISNLTDVMPYVDDNFIVSEKEGVTYINYKHLAPDVFPDFIEGDDEHNHRAAIRRELRGIAFNTATGELISRPFHKFFNHGERPCSEWTLDEPHRVMEKLDGSMIRPIRHPDGTIRLATKMGVTSVAMDAEAFIAGKPHYLSFMRVFLGAGYTPIFEYVGPHNRVVLEYEEDLILLAIRDNYKGYYFEEDWYEDVFPGIPIVKSSGLSLEEVKALESDEGVVIQYPNGCMVKVKSDWYVKAHRAKDLLSSPRRFVESLVDSTYDDAYASFLQPDKDKAAKMLAEFSERLSVRATAIQGLYHQWRQQHPTKKDFAVASKDFKDPLSLFYRAAAFKLWDGKVETGRDYIWECLGKAITSNRKFDETMKSMEITFDGH